MLLKTIWKRLSLFVGYSMTHGVRSAVQDHGTAPTHDEIRTALESILASPEFTGSNQRRRFLQFVVEEAIAGREQGLKGVVIADEVYRRGSDFDSKSDPVVRLEARRLRRDLDSYYVGPGRADPIRISMPKGGYAPLFETLHSTLAHTDTSKVPEPAVEGPPSPTRRQTSYRALAIKALVLIPIFVGFGFFWSQWSDDPAAGGVTENELPRVVVLPFRALDPSQNTFALASGLGSDLVFYLGQFQGLRLYAPMAVDVPAEKLKGLVEDHIPSYIVRGQVLTEGSRASVLVHLAKAGSDEIVWNDVYDLQLSPGSLIDLRDAVSAEIATALGQQYGPLVEDIQLSADRDPPASLESYLCVQRAHSYRRTFSQAEFGPVRDCLEAAVTRNPEFADAWAMLGWARLDAARYRFVPQDRIDTEYAAALAAAQRAYSLDPSSVLTLKALSAIHHHVGNYEEGERFGRRALELNPNDPDTLAQVGWRLAVRGKFDEGVPLLQRSLERTVDPPAWYYHLLSIHHLIEGNARQALELGELSAAKGSGFGSFLVAAAAGALGESEKAKLALKGIGASPALASDPADFMRRHGATDEIVEKLMSAYSKARRLVSDLENEELTSKM